MILDALNYQTNSFTLVNADNAESVFESLITVGDVAYLESQKVNGLDIPEPPLHLTAMSYCETAVASLRGDKPDIDAFDENCELYDLADVASQSKWLDRKTLENLQTTLKKDAKGLVGGSLDSNRVLEKHHTTPKLCAALAQYVKKVIEKMGPSFLERVAADIGSGKYSPDTETRVISGTGKQSEAETLPTGIVVPSAVAKGHVGVEQGFKGTQEEEDTEESEDKEEAPQKENQNKPPSRVVEIAKGTSGRPRGGDAWSNLAKHAEASGQPNSEDDFQFEGSDEESPGAAAAKRRKRFENITKPGNNNPAGKTIAWGACQLGETQVETPVGGGVRTSTAARGTIPTATIPTTTTSRPTPTRTTPGSIGRKYQRWTSDEETYFIELCDKLGEGNWAAILKEGIRQGNLREGLTAVHLKDKWRNLSKKRRKGGQ